MASVATRATDPARFRRRRIDLDSRSDPARGNAEAVFTEELEWAAHLSLSAVLLPPPTESPTNYARAVSAALERGGGAGLWVPVPATLPDGSDPWRRWDAVRHAAEENPRVGVCLVLTAGLPADAALARWDGEPVRAVAVSTALFARNAAGFPALPAPLSAFLSRLLRVHAPRVVLTGPVPGDDPAAYAPYLAYVRHKGRERAAGRTEADALEEPYRDYMQAPLQPLKDDLESQTYETFERDPVKYARYEEAVRLALLAWRAGGPPRPRGEDDAAMDAALEAAADTDARRAVVMVVGAGRGPLVACALRAAEAAGAAVTVYAVEKNPNAVVTLEARRLREWGDRVRVVSSDMREWEAPALADVVVSELLGSFGDNELSPECLDGAERFLAPGGVSIPAGSVSHLAPLSTPKLWSQLRARGARDALETPYVVKLHEAWEAAPPQPVFEFVHPAPASLPPPGSPARHRRHRRLEFTAAEDATVHGFSGYFESRLFGDVSISILPSTKSEGMFSWFPVYFPLRAPLRLARGERLEVHVWRESDGRRVWYEWCVAGRHATPVHNVGGRSYSIGLH